MVISYWRTLIVGSSFITRTTIYGSGYATNGSAYGKTRTNEFSLNRGSSYETRTSNEWRILFNSRKWRFYINEN